MTPSPTITTLFLDVGQVLLTDSWGPTMRQRAVDAFGFDFAEVAKRSQLTFEGYEEGKISLDEYLDWVVFHEKRSFSREALTEFMLAQSQPHPEMLALARSLKVRYGLKVAVVTNDGREFIVHRVQRFGLKEFVDFFVVSCFVHCRKPETEIYRMALDIAQVDPRSLASYYINSCHIVQAKTRSHAATSWVFCAFVVVFRVFENAGAPSPAWPSENDHSQLQVANVTIAADIAPGRLTLSRDQVLTWIAEAARAVVHYYGRFPVSQLQILVTPVRGKGAPSGTTFGQPHPRISVALGEAADEEFLRRDWMMVHEMVHLAFPRVAKQHHWIEEGLATYIEPWARLGIGQLTEETVWKDLVEGLPKGLPGPEDKGLDRTPTWGRTYWGGALFCLLADVEIRKRTANQRGLHDAVRGIVAAGGSMQEQWSLTRTLEIGDQATGVPVLTELYEQMKETPTNVDLADLWQQLGIEVRDGAVVFHADAPLASVREAITRSVRKSEAD